VNEFPNFEAERMSPPGGKDPVWSKHGRRWNGTSLRGNALANTQQIGANQSSDSFSRFRESRLELFHGPVDAGRTSRLARTRPSLWKISGHWAQIGRVLLDLFFLLVNFYALYDLDSTPVLASLQGLGTGRLPHAFHNEHLAVLLLSAGFTVLLLKSAGLYCSPRSGSNSREILGVGMAIVTATLLLAIFIHLSRIEAVSQGFVLCSGFLNLVTFTGWRLLKRKVTDRSFPVGKATHNVLIIGAGKRGLELAEFLENNKQLGYVVRGFLDADGCDDPRAIGRIDQLSQIARARFIDEILIATPSPPRLVREIVLEARRNRLDVTVAPDLYDDLCDGRERNVALNYLGHYPVLTLHQEPVPTVALLLKRAMDVVLGSLGVIFVSPLLLGIALAIKLDSSGPVFYKSYRRGSKGRTFACLKFRTMATNADELKNELRGLNERRGPFFKLANDPRVTKLGKVLRKYSLDELPQLWNVIKGDMSLVGPRPHPIDDCQRYSLEHLCRLDVTPGITGLWQISSRRDPSFEKSMLLDLEYIEKWSLWEDIKILLKTLPVVVRADGQ
jgi:exopolysaccharide biosynthesis polyprenyl glycosylphosphotransferase